MKKVLFLIALVYIFTCQNAFSYDECFDGDCYSHLNYGWATQGGLGCVKTGFKWKREYRSPQSVKEKAYFYIAVNNTSSNICERPSVINMKMFTFRRSSKNFEAFQELIKKAIDWCWIANNNKIKFSKKNIGKCVTDNNLKLNLFIYSDGTVKGTFVRLESKHKRTHKNYNWKHLNQHDLTRLKRDLSALPLSLENYVR